MMLDPFQRFLGVEEGADAATLLGLGDGPIDAARIEEALRLKLAKVYMHPDGRSFDAERVRLALRNAAAQLKAAGVRTPVSAARQSGRAAPPHARGLSRPAARTSSTLMNLTAFDRMALAVLVGCGGWNAASRARLVALAASYGIAPQGLIHVLRGLADYARSGGPRLDAQQIAGFPGMPLPSGNGHRTPLSKRPVPSATVIALTKEAETDLWWTRYRMGVVYAAIGLVLSLILLRLIMGPSAPPPSAANRQSVSSPSASSITAASPDTAPTSTQPSANSRMARFSKVPTFLGNGLPFEAVSAVDQCPLVAGDIDQIARQIAVSPEPSQPALRNWDASIETIASAWTLADASTRSAIDRAIFEALRISVDRPATSDRLLSTLTPPPGGQTISQPIDIWRSTWAAGTLGKLSTSSDLPPVIVERARHQLQTVLNTSSRLPMTFEAAAAAWLDGLLPQLVEAIEFDDQTYDSWELWLAAQRKLGRGPAFDLAVMNALTMILATPTDLYRPGPSLNVAARLLNTALENPSREVRQHIIALFDNEQIATRDLWVITSLMAVSDHVPWFDESLVVPEEADQRHRWRLRDALAKAWPGLDDASPSQAQRQIVFDEAAAERWGRVADQILNLPAPRSPEHAMQYLVLASAAHEAAEAMLMERHNTADDRLIELEVELGQGREAGAGMRSTPPLTSAAAVPPRPGQPLGRDGEWASLYQQLGRSAEPRVQSILALRNSAGTDLGAIDAELFVREAYRATPPEVRTAVQTLLLERFATGPNIAMDVLDQFADATPSETISELVQTLAGVVLPDSRSEDWAVQARLALVRHVLALQPQSMMELDILADWLTESYARRVSLLLGAGAPPSSPQNPQEAATLLEGIWADRAAVLVTSRPTPDTAVNLRRRHQLRLKLANGPVQIFVAHQATTLEWLAYVTAAEQPQIRDAVLATLNDSSRRRAKIASGIEQALEIERAGLRLWKLRMGLGESPRMEAMR